MSAIQGCKIQSNVSAIDFNNTSSHFATGGRQCIKIFELKRGEDCWYDCKKTIGKYKGTNITKTCVSQMAWNKQGADIIAIGTTSGYVLAYEAANPYKNIMQTKGHDGNINNIEWNPGSRANFVSSSFQNYICQWDLRQSDKIGKYQYSDNTKIRDIKFNPLDNSFAVQSSTKLQISDIRNPTKIIATHQIHDNQLQGIGVQWDPINKFQIASAISKQINIFSIQGDKLQLKDTISHYALIKSFYWMVSKQNHFGVLGQHPQKNIFFYDLEDKNRIAYMYGGHGRSIDCWKMDLGETTLLSASNIRQKNTRAGNGGSSNNWALLVAQYTYNYFDPNQPKFNYPITYDNDNNIAFCINNDEPINKKSFNAELNRKKSSKCKQTPPLIYSCCDSINWYQKKQTIHSLKEQIIYLHKNYIIDGKNSDIVHNNAAVAKKIGKNKCEQFWKCIFTLAFPLQQQQHTIDSIFQQKLQLDVSIIQNRVTLYNKQQIIKQTVKIDVNQLLQWLVDQNQLQTAVLASICLMNKNPSIVSQQFMYKIFSPYIELLGSFQLFDISADTILQTKNNKFTDITQKNTGYIITCGWCKESVTKGNCKCNLLCVICQGRLSQRYVIWCKYCGHGGHAIEYQKWFKEDKKQFCPYGCGHACFTADDF